MNFSIEPATRASVKPLIGFYGKSGGGKTLSSLLVARGIAGPKGRIVVIDTENRRASIFADVVVGGYSVINVAPPFSPERYWEAIQAAESASDVIVVDSFSHEWAGEGGVLDMQEGELERMAGDNWSKREACKMSSWIKPKMAHKRLVERLLRLSQPLIVCLRGEEKTHMDKDDKGKTQVHTDKFSSPIADPRFIFEMLIHAEVFAKPNDAGHMIGGYLRITKITHHDIISLLPKNGEQIGIAHGEALARWCLGGKAQAPAPKLETSKSISTSADLKRQLWKLTSEIHGGDKAKLNQWLHDQKILGESESLETVTPEQLTFVIDKCEIALSEIVP